MSKHRDVGKGKWQPGTPPSVGWWPASISRNPCALRWWNGTYWGKVAYAGDYINFIKRVARQMEDPWLQPDIEWRERADWWPARSRT